MTAAKRNRWGHRDATMVLVAYRHGLRASELADLRWAQVEFATATLHVHRVKHGTPSTHPILGDELRALRRLQREQEPKSPFVFTLSGAGSTFQHRWFRPYGRAGRGLRPELGFKAHPPHASPRLRLRAGEQGHDTRALQAYLAHRNIQQHRRLQNYCRRRGSRISGEHRSKSRAIQRLLFALFKGARQSQTPKWRPCRRLTQINAKRQASVSASGLIRGQQCHALGLGICIRARAGAGSSPRSPRSPAVSPAPNDENSSSGSGSESVPLIDVRVLQVRGGHGGGVARGRPHAADHADRRAGRQAERPGHLLRRRGATRAGTGR